VYRSCRNVFYLHPLTGIVGRACEAVLTNCFEKFAIRTSENPEKGKKWQKNPLFGKKNPTKTCNIRNY
jgi:hypothetical protein